MNYGSLIFLGAFFALASSWFGLVLMPQVYLGRQQLTNTVTAAAYPIARPGLAQRGAEVYRANGCAYCHSQQVRQTGTTFDLIVTDVGTNRIEVANALFALNYEVTHAESGTTEEDVEHWFAVE